MDKRAPGGLNLKKGGTEPQTSVSLWNQRKHSDYKLKKKNNVTTRTKKLPKGSRIQNRPSISVCKLLFPTKMAVK